MQDLIERAVHPDPAVAAPAAVELFRDLIEPLSDSFDSAACRRYVELFVPILARLLPDLEAGALAARYQRVRRLRRFDADPGAVRHVFVLSRVTLGADVAVTSVLLDAAKKKFPAAAIHFAGGRKGWELFEADRRLGWLPVEYPRRAPLAEALGVRSTLGAALARPQALVIDPDSRLTQLGLVPVCDEDRYYFFGSRDSGGEGDQPLPELARRWAEETFGVADAAPYIAPAASDDAPEITVSLGVGDNLRKRLADPFEEEILRRLARLQRPMLVDLGAGDEEAGRVRHALSRSGAAPGQIRTWDGAFAPFADRIRRSRLYVGYDSAGQHVAAACGVPLVSVFAGFPSPRLWQRWRPTGRGPIEVVRVDRPDPAEVLERVDAAIGRLLTAHQSTMHDR